MDCFLFFVFVFFETVWSRKYFSFTLMFVAPSKALFGRSFDLEKVNIVLNQDK